MKFDKLPENTKIQFLSVPDFRSYYHFKPREKYSCPACDLGHKPTEQISLNVVEITWWDKVKNFFRKVFK